jgi:putative flippase GtrA
MTVDHGPPRVRDGGMPQMDFVAVLPHALRRSLHMMPQLSRYAAVSGLALALDLAVFMLLNRMLALPTLAGVIGYACGIVLHYQLSRRFVFAGTGSRKSAHRLFGEFFASGLIGLVVTAAVIAFATSALGIGPLPAKVIAIAASFLGVFLIRRSVVFA